MILILIALVVACWLSVCVRIVVAHPILTVINAAKDLYHYFRYKEWRLCKTGKITCYVGLFGKGKTLSAVHDVVSKYYRYNDKLVWDKFRRKWVTQKVHIISNVDLSIPFERFISLAQVVAVADKYHKLDEENNTLTIHLVLGDEFSVQLNSRSFKSNIDPLFLNTLLTCRHHHISLVYTSQRFLMVDKLLREVTSSVIDCDKCWRLMVHKLYDAYELENASTPRDVKPLRRFGWFVRDRDYNAYDTLACVDNLKKSCQSGDMLSDTEILALQENQPSDMDAVRRPSRSYIRRMRKTKRR